MANENEKMVKELECCLTTEFVRNGIDSLQLNDCLLRIVSIIGKYDVQEKKQEIVETKISNAKLFKTYVACLRLEGKSEKTIAQYLRTNRQFSDFINKSFLNVDSFDVRMFLVTLKARGCSNRTMENQKSYISAFFKWLAKERYIEFNPVESINKIKFKDKERLPFNDIEIDVMRRSLTNKKHRAIFEMLLHTGARASELCNFNLEDIDLDNRIAYIINGKGGKNRKVYFNQMTAKYLKEYFELRKDNNPAAFISKQGERITPNGVRAILKSLSDKCGVNNIHPHRFRRTLATTLAERGMPLNEIMIILGHANLNTTRIYIFSADKHVNSSYNRIYGD